MRIDNTGAGNCMYYAYSISLMYYLLKKQNPETTEFVFNQLKLNPLQKRQLNALLNDKSITVFTTRQIKQIIEPILATAAREVAAEQTKQVFMENHQNNQVATSSVYAALCYGMVYLFRQEMLKRKAPEACLLERNSFDDPTFTRAEIYQLFPINSPELKQHITQEYDAIMLMLQNGWEAKALAISERLKQEHQSLQARRNELMGEVARLREIYEDPSTLGERNRKIEDLRVTLDRPIKTVEEIQGNEFFKKEYLEELINNETIKFFTKDNFRYLNRYIDHLKTNYVWGSEESLLLLHAYVQGTTRSEPVPGQFLFTPRHPIEMDIYVNGAPKPGNLIPNPDMVLNNEYNSHWTSLVEPTPSSTGHQLGPSQSEEEKRIGLLTLSGFTACLEQLETYAAELCTRDSQAGQQGFQMADELIKQRDSFIAPTSKVSTRDFCNNSIAIIDNNKLSLEQHSGFSDLFNMMLNALIFIPNVLIGLGNLFYGKFVLIDYDRLKPESTKIIHRFKTSVTALIENNKGPNEDGPDAKTSGP